MKILAIEKEIKAAFWENETQVLLEEAESVYKMLLSGHLREIYFNEYKNAILILECENRSEAKQLLDKLPLAKNCFIGFEIMELQPYTGLSRLFG